MNTTPAQRMQERETEREKRQTILFFIAIGLVAVAIILFALIYASNQPSFFENTALRMEECLTTEQFTREECLQIITRAGK